MNKDYKEKYFKYKKKYLDLKKVSTRLFQLGGEYEVYQTLQDIDGKLSFINSLSLPIIIILGAVNDEDHIRLFVENLTSKHCVICISNIKVEQPLISVGNPESKSPVIHLSENFNDIELWNKLKYLNEVNKIIVDWSVVKFFSTEYNIIIGKIMKIIFNLLIINGEFYSECCHSMNWMNRENTHLIPGIYNYAMSSPEWDLPEIRPGETQEETKNRVDREYIEKYVEKLKYYTPVNYEMNYHTIPLPEYDTYPLKNSHRSIYPFNYFVLRKKHD